MTFRVSFQADIGQLNRGLSSLDRDIRNKAIPRSLNVAARRTRTAFVRQLTRDLNLKRQKVIRDKVRPSRATRSRPVATLWFNPRGLNPLTLGIQPGQAKQYYNGDLAGEPFTATMPNGSRQIVARKPSSRSSIGEDSKGRPRRGRLPVDAIRVRVGRKGIDLMNRLLRTVGREAMVKEYTRQINLIRASR